MCKCTHDSTLTQMCTRPYALRAHRRLHGTLFFDDWRCPISTNKLKLLFHPVRNALITYIYVCVYKYIYNMLHPGLTHTCMYPKQNLQDALNDSKRTTFNKRQLSEDFLQCVLGVFWVFSFRRVCGFMCAFNFGWRQHDQTNAYTHTLSLSLSPGGSSSATSASTRRCSSSRRTPPRPRCVRLALDSRRALLSNDI